MQKSNLRLIVLVMGAGLLTACVSTAIVGPGDVQGTIPPKIAVDSNKNKVWDFPSAFGPVPSELQATGDAICKGAGASRATGYHAKAMDDQGQSFPGGGYFCVKD